MSPIPIPIGQLALWSLGCPRLACIVSWLQRQPSRQGNQWYIHAKKSMQSTNASLMQRKATRWQMAYPLLHLVCIAQEHSSMVCAKNDSSMPLGSFQMIEKVMTAKLAALKVCITSPILSLTRIIHWHDVKVGKCCDISEDTYSGYLKMVLANSSCAQKRILPNNNFVGILLTNNTEMYTS